MKARSELIVVAASLVLVACAEQSAIDEGAPVEEAATSATEVEVVELDVEQVSSLLEGGDVRLIDVRTDEEVAEGVIPGAEQIVLDDFDPAKLDLSDGREVVLYCRSGRRSGIAAEKLAAHTGKPAKHLAGGITAWREAGKETAPPIE